VRLVAGAEKFLAEDMDPSYEEDEEMVRLMEDHHVVKVFLEAFVADLGD
jgi:hypothetical protein